MRFWDVKKFSSESCLVFLMEADHFHDFFDTKKRELPYDPVWNKDQLTAIAATSDNNYLITGDTRGGLKMWDFSDHIFGVHKTTEHIRVQWFIHAHKSLINTISVVEMDSAPQNYVITASNDHNIHLHRLRDGIFIG